MTKVKHEIAPRLETIEAADRLHSAAIHLLRRARLQDVRTGIGPAQLSALSVLVFAGPRTLGELANAEQVKPPTMSRIVASLRRNHLIEISRDPQDARRMRIRASKKGVGLMQRARRQRIEYIAAHLETLTSSELAQIRSVAEAVENLLRHWK